MLGWLGYIWAWPGTLLGYLLAVVYGWRRSHWATVSGRGHVTRVRVVYVRWLLPAMADAQTWGHVVLARGSGVTGSLLVHEATHTRQWRCWGPLFLVAYPLASLWSGLRGQGYYQGNYFERKARGE
jgi:hypothetical protein